jgi:hypothetical protein
MEEAARLRKIKAGHAGPCQPEGANRIDCNSDGRNAMAVTTFRFRIHTPATPYQILVTVHEHDHEASVDLTYDSPDILAPFTEGTVWPTQSDLTFTPRAAVTGGNRRLFQFRMPADAGLLQLQPGYSTGGLLEIAPNREIPAEALPDGVPPTGWRWDYLGH